MQNNLSTSCWGPPLWASIQSISIGYPDHNTDPKLAQKYKLFFESLGYVIPCEKCRKHYNQYLKKYPIDNALGGSRDLLFWVYTMHNKVNQSTGVPKEKWPSFESVYKLYNSMRSESCGVNPQEEKACTGEDTSLKCKLQFVTKEHFGDGSEQYWWVVLLVIILLIAMIVFIVMKSQRCKRKRK